MAIQLMPGNYKRQGNIKSKNTYSFLRILEPKAGLILIVCMILLILSVLAWSVLWLQSNSLINQKQLIEAQIQELQDHRDVDLENTLIELDDGITMLDSVLKERIYPVNIFSVLESLVLPEVVFSDFNSDILKAKVGIQVTASNYNKLAEQMVVFEEDERIKNVEFSGINLSGEGEAISNFQIDLDPILLMIYE